MEEWKTYRLEEIGNIVGGATPSTKDDSNYDGEIAWITPKDLSNYSYRYISRGERMVSSKGFDSCSCKMLPKNSVLFSSRAPIGYVAIAGNKLCTNQGFKSIIPNSDIVDYRFLYYWLLNNKSKIENMGSGTTFKEVSASVMKNITIQLPSLQSQENIANILSSIDDKIELNKRINDNLEQQAQALFKSWFVDFEPFKNGRFVESELGMIPEGWRVVELGEVTIEQKRKVGNIENVKVLSPVNSGELQLSEEYFTKQVFSQSLSKYILVNPKDFAYNPARVNIGSLGMNTFDFVGCVSPVYVVFRCETEYEYFFDLYRHRQLFKEEVIARSIGGVRQTLGYKDFSMIKLIYPPKEIVQSFNTLYHSLLNNQERIKIENREMAEIRDSILPRLMSGELKIKDLN